MKDLLLLHGALGSSKEFKTIIPLLQPIFNIHVLDFEGHGNFNSSKEFSMELFSQNVLDYVAEHELEGVDVFGFSMGGYVALNTVLKETSAIGKIVTLGTKFDWNPETAQKEVQMLDPDKIVEKVPKYADKLSQEHQQDWKQVLHKTGRMMIGLSEGNKFVDEDFLKIQNSVVIGIGSQDHMVSIEESEKIAGLLPNGTLQVLEGAKHPIGMVDSNLLVKYIMDNF